MQRHPVAFGIEKDGAEAIRADLFLLYQNLAPTFGDGFLRLIVTAIHVEVNQRAFFRGFVVLGHHEAAGDILVLVREQPKFHVTMTFLAHLDSENRRIKFNRALEVGDGDVGPDDGVFYAHGKSAGGIG